MDERIPVPAEAGKSIRRAAALNNLKPESREGLEHIVKMQVKDFTRGPQAELFPPERYFADFNHGLIVSSWIRFVNK